MIIVFSIKPDYLPDGDPELKMGVYNENLECLEHEGTKFWKLTSGKDVVYFTECLPNIKTRHYKAKRRVEDKQELLGIRLEDEVYYFFHDHEITSPFNKKGEIAQTDRERVHWHIAFHRLMDNVFLFQHTSDFFNGIVNCDNLETLLNMVRQRINGNV